MRSKLLTRILSAIGGLILLSGIYWYIGVMGLLVFAILLATLCIIEIARLLVPPNGSTDQNVFIGLSAITLSCSVFFPDLALAAAALAILILISFLLVEKRNDGPNLDERLRLTGAAVLGLLYSAVLPSFVIRLLSYTSGDKWLFTYLAIVFMGDTFAYFAGKYLGKKKLMESVSPQKTIEGAIGGVVGNAMAGLLAYILWLNHLNPVGLIAIAIITGVFAQIGDLFESLLKRVAKVKDSGNLMPGHGGLLDRLDGIYFAAPLFFVAVHFLD